MRCETAGTRPSTALPRITPAKISPATLGCRNLTKNQPSNCARATSKRRTKRTDVKAELDKEMRAPTGSDALRQREFVPQVSGARVAGFPDRPSLPWSKLGLRFLGLRRDCGIEVEHLPATVAG